MARSGLADDWLQGPVTVFTFDLDTHSSEPTFRTTPHAASMAAAPEEPAWKEPTVFRLAEVLCLPAGWDSYGAPRIDRHAVSSALALLESAAPEEMPAPLVVPVSDGGVQLEWHAWGLDVELEVPPAATTAQLFFRDRRIVQEQEENQELGADLTALSTALKVLTERAREAIVR